MNLLSGRAHSCCESIASSQLVHCLHSSSIFPFQYIQSVVPDSPPLMVSYTQRESERREREERDFTPNSSQSIEVSKSLLSFGLKDQRSSIMPKGKDGAKKSLDGQEKSWALFSSQHSIYSTLDLQTLRAAELCR